MSVIGKTLPRVPHPTPDPPHQFGEYTLVRRIGAGGQGEVYEARDALGLTWALKIGHRVHSDDERALARFTREAQWVNATFGALPRNCGILVGEHYGVFDQRFYVKMRLVEGESLAQRLRREGPLTAVVAVELARELANIIAIAHGNNAIHRDLKPENVLIEGDGSLQVVDWGCIHLVEAGHFAQSAASPLCTLGYAAPEQYELKRGASVATDVYALGVMLLEMLTNYNPFLGAWRNDQARVAVANGASVTRTARHGAVSPGPTGLYPTGVLPAARPAHPDAITRNTAVTDVVQLEERLAEAAVVGDAPSSWPVVSQTAQPRSVQDVVGRQLSFDWKALGDLTSGMPAALAELVEQMLQPKPERRPSSMREIAERLTSIETELILVAPGTAPSPGRRGRRSGRVLLVALSAVLVGGVLVAVRRADEAPLVVAASVEEQAVAAVATSAGQATLNTQSGAPTATSGLPLPISEPPLANVESAPDAQQAKTETPEPARRVDAAKKPRAATTVAPTSPTPMVDAPYFGSR